MTEFIIILLTSFVATFLSSMSGGGASIINLPVLLSLGISFPLATAAQKISSSFWTLPAAFNYLRKSRVDWFMITVSALVGLVGAYLGVQLIISIDKNILQKSVGVLILILVFVTYFKKDLGENQIIIKSKIKTYLYYISTFVLGFYESIFGAGNGILFTFSSVYLKGLEFREALGYYFSIAFSWCVFAACLLVYRGYWDLNVFVPIVVGSLLGGFFGSKLAVYKGNGFIKIMFVIIGLFLGIKLLFNL
jgi:uncharacterized membrane protein YfcA